MIKFLENLGQLENKKTKVLLKHSLWGEQRFQTEALHIINDERVGIRFKGQELYVYKNSIKDFGVDVNRLWVTDGRFTIIVNKL